MNYKYLEGLVISPTVSDDSFEHSDFGGGEARTVVISSDNNTSESEYSYQSSDSDDSEQSEVPNFPNKFKSRSGLKAGLRDTGLYRLDGLGDTL